MEIAAECIAVCYVLCYCTVMSYTCFNLKLDTQPLPGVQQEVLYEEFIDVGCIKWQNALHIIMVFLW